MKKLTNNITAMSFILIVVIVPNFFAQNKTTHFIKDYYSLHSFAEYTHIFEGFVNKEDPTVNYSVIAYNSASYGFLFNVFQTNKWNFKTGLILKPRKLAEFFNFSKEQTGRERDLFFTTELSGDDTMWSVPFISEYIYPISRNWKWSISSSFTISSYIDYGGFGEHFHNAKMYITMDNRANKPIHTSAEISTGFYFLFKHFMLQPEFRFSKSFSTLKSGSYVTKNYRTNPESSKGTYKQSGDYWGISLSIYLKKKQKNKK